MNLKTILIKNKKEVQFTAENLESLKNQDVFIFESLFTMYAKKIYNFLLIKTNGNHESAGDLLNDTFLSAFESAPKLKSGKNILSWLIKIAHRRFIDYQRKIFREKKYIEILKQNYSHKYTVEDELYKKEKVLLLDLALDKINSEYKTILCMKYKDGKTSKAISTLLGKTERSIVSILYRAKEAIRKEIKKLSKEYLKGKKYE